jgi:hypothetical protein
MYIRTGLVSTSINYQVPVMLMLYSLLPVVNAIRTESTPYGKCRLPLRIIGFITVILSTLIASNHEQLLAIFSLILFCISIYICVTKRFILKNIWVRIILFSQWVIILISYVYTSTCLGNKVRYSIEMNNKFPEYKELTAANKIGLGLKAYVFDLYSGYDKVFAIFVILVIFVACSRTRSLFNASLGILISISFFIFIPSKIHFLSDMSLTFSRNVCIVIIISLLSLIYLVYSAFQKRTQRLIASGIFVIGIASKVMIGFSPTVFASHIRTGYIAVCALFAIVVMLAEELMQKYNQVEGLK